MRVISLVSENRYFSNFVDSQLVGNKFHVFVKGVSYFRFVDFICPPPSPSVEDGIMGVVWVPKVFSMYFFHLRVPGCIF